MSEGPVVEVEGLTIRYRRMTAVEDLTLAVPPGSVYALLGRNGSGKSSTVRCLLGQQRATAGQVRLLGLDAWKRRCEIMASVGVVAETPNVPPEMTADRLQRFMAAVSAKCPLPGSERPETIAPTLVAAVCSLSLDHDRPLGRDRAGHPLEVERARFPIAPTPRDRQDKPPWQPAFRKPRSSILSNGT